MSTSIENRVVSMKFDNSNFEKNVKVSLGTIEKLKQALRFDETKKSFDNLSKSAGKIDMNTLSSGVEAVKVKFSAMEVVAINALTRISNKAFDAGERIVKSLTVDQLSQGFSKYEEKTNAVQTLVNSTGKSMEEINAQLDKLMKYSDETSYSFTEMVNAYSQLTTVGGDFEKIPDMIMGIANATAFAGKTGAAFTSTIRNLTQSYGAQYLQLMDWKSLQNQGTASKQLIEELIRAGEELGTIEQKGSITAANFAETLKDKWANTQVMELAFSRFNALSKAAIEAVDAGEYETVTEAIEDLSDKFDTLSVRAFQSAQEAKSFTEAIDATKDAVSSGWMKTWEIIFGDYNEAKALWTGVTDVLWRTFAASSEVRNEMMETWKENGGRTAAIQAFVNVLNALASAFRPIKLAWEETFGAIGSEKGKALAETTKRIAEFTEKLILSDGAVESLKDAFKGILDVSKLLRDTVFTVIKAVFPNVSTWRDVLNLVALILGGIGKTLSKIVSTIRESGVITTVANVITIALLGILTVLVKIATAIYNIFSAIKNSTLVQGIINGFLSTIVLIGATIGKVVTDLLEFISIATDKSQWAGFEDNTFVKMFTKIDNVITNIKNKITEFKKSVSDFFKSIREGSKVGEAFSKAFEPFTSKIKALFDGTVFAKMRNGLKESGGLLETFGQKLKAFKESLSTGRIVALAFTLAVLAVTGTISKVLSSLNGLLVTASSTVGMVKKVISTLWLKNTNFAQVLQSFAYLTGAIAALIYIAKDVPTEKLKVITTCLLEIVGAVGGITVALVGLATIITKIQANSKRSITSINGLGLIILSLAGSAAILVTALKMLNQVDMVDAASKLGIIGLALAGFTAIVGAFNVAMHRFAMVETSKNKIFKGWSTSGAKTAIIILAFSMAVKNLTKSLVDLAGLTNEQLLVGVKSISQLMLVLGAMMMGMSNINLGTAAGLWVTLKILQTTVPKLISVFAALTPEQSSMLFSNVLNFSESMMVLMSSLAIIFAVVNREVNKIKISVGKMAIGIGLIAGEIAIISTAFKNMTVKDIGPIVAGIGIMAATFIGFYNIIKVFQGFDKRHVDVEFVKIAKALQRIAIASLIVTANIAILKEIWGDVIGKDESGKSKLNGKALVGFAGALVTIAGIFFSFKGLLKSMSGLEKVHLGGVSAIFAGITFMIGEIIALSFITQNDKDFIALIRSIGLVVGVVATIMAGLTFINLASGKIRGKGASLNIIMTMLGIASLIAAMSTAVYALKDIPNVNEVTASIAAAVGVVTLMGLMVTTVSSITTTMSKHWRGNITKPRLAAFKMEQISQIVNTIIAYAGIIATATIAIPALAKAVENLSSIEKVNWQALGQVGAILIGIIAMYIGLNKWLNKLSVTDYKKTALNIIGITGILTLFGHAILPAYVKIVKQLGEIKSVNWNAYGQLEALMGSLVGIIALIPGIISYFARDDKQYAKALGSMLAVSLVLAGLSAHVIPNLVEAVRQLSEIPNDASDNVHNFIKILSALAIAVGVLSGLSAALTKGGSGGMIALLAMLIGGGLLVAAIKESAELAGSLASLIPELVKLQSVDFDYIANGFKSIFNALWTKVGSGTGSRTNSIAEMLKGLNDDFDQVKETITTWNSEMEAKGETLGYYFLVGFRNGITANIQSVQNAAMTLGYAAERGVRIANNTNSPSIVATNLGGFFGLGFKNGIESMIPSAGTAGLKLGTVAMIGTGNAIATNTTLVATAAEEGIVNPIVEANQAIIDDTKNMGFSLSNIWNGLVSGVKLFGSNVKEAFNMDGNFFYNFGKTTAENAGGTFVDKIKNGGVSAVSEALTNAVTNAVGEDALNSFKDKWYEFTNEFSSEDFLADTLGGVSDVFEQIKDDGESAFGDIADAAGSAANKIETFWTKIRKSVESVDIFSKFDLEQSISAEDMLDTLNSNIAGVEKWANNLATLAARGLNEDLYKQLAEKGPSSYKQVAAFAAMTDDQLRQANEMSNMLAKLPIQAADEVDAGMTYIKDIAIDGFSDALNEYAAVVGGDRLITTITSQATEEAKSAQTKRKLAEASKIVTDEFGYTYIQAIKNSGIGKGSGDAYKEELIEGIDTAVQAASDHLKEQVTALWNKEHGLVPDTAALESLVKTDLSRTAEGRNIINKSKDFGELYSQGLAAGLIRPETKAKVTASITEVTDHMSGVMRKNLEIHSPSRVAAELGGYYTIGLGEGMVDKLGYLDDAAFEITDNLKEAFMTSFDRMQNEMNEGGSLKLRPVVDLTSVQNGVDSLNGNIISDQATMAATSYNNFVLSQQQTIAELRGIRQQQVVQTEALIECIKSIEPSGTDVTVTLDANSRSIFNMVRSETSKFVKATGYNPLI